MEWIRGERLGQGSFGFVTKAIVTRNAVSVPSVFAAKSAFIDKSSSLKTEKEILEKLRDCPNVVRFFGSDISEENGDTLYNLFLELASCGSLASLIKKSDGHMAESDIRKYAREMLAGLAAVHHKGFVHCDVKPQNVLLFDAGVAKMADFGAAKKKGSKRAQGELGGTPRYMAPESFTAGEYGSACDVWAAGLVVAEMVTGKMPWERQTGTNLWKLMMVLTHGDDLPDIPEELSDDGKDFLRKCFVRDPQKRWTAEMLLDHPFVSERDLRAGIVDGFMVASVDYNGEILCK